MTCVQLPGVVICRPDVESRWVARHKCPTCNKRTKFLCEHEGWYGVYFTCLSCGDRWGDGEMLERPFCRGWRQENIKHAKDIIKTYNVKERTK